MEKRHFLPVRGQSADTGWSAGGTERLVSGPLIPHNLGGMHRFSQVKHMFGSAVICTITQVCCIVEKESQLMGTVDLSQITTLLEKPSLSVIS